MKNKKFQNLDERLKAIKLIIFDVDGVLTDGRIYLVGEKEEMKVFCGRDRPPTNAALKSGLKILLLTGRKCAAVERRARELGAEIWFKRELKAENISLFEQIKLRLRILPSQVLYVGDDWSDLHFMSKAGIAATPKNGSLENRKMSDIVCKAKGGEGVAAEIIKLVMQAKGTWNKHQKAYLQELNF